jgi:peptide/nickel transport system permease protein
VWAYLLRRLGAGIIVLLVLSFGVFVLVALSGDPLAQLRENPQVSPRTIAAAAAQLHLNEPLLERYWSWLTGLLLHGSLGTSYTGQPVGSQIAQRLAVTLKLVVPAAIVSVLLGVVVGVVSAVRQYKPVDHVSTGMAYLFFSTPVFVLGLLLKDFLAVDLNKAVGHTVLYTVGQSSPGVTGGSALINELQHAILPVLTLTLITYATWSRFQRAAMLDVLNADYIRLARAKGLSPRRVLFVHALRNALTPVVTVVAIDFAALLGGAVVTEIVFSWDGMGQYLLNGLTGAESPDVYAVQGWLMVAGSAVIGFNILADLLYGLLDPRVRHA